MFGFTIGISGLDEEEIRVQDAVVDKPETEVLSSVAVPLPRVEGVAKGTEDRERTVVEDTSRFSAPFDNLTKAINNQTDRVLDFLQTRVSVRRRSEAEGIPVIIQDFEGITTAIVPEVVPQLPFPAEEPGGAAGRQETGRGAPEPGLLRRLAAKGTTAVGQAATGTDVIQSVLSRFVGDWAAEKLTGTVQERLMGAFEGPGELAPSVAQAPFAEVRETEREPDRIRGLLPSPVATPVAAAAVPFASLADSGMTEDFLEKLTEISVALGEGKNDKSIPDLLESLLQIDFSEGDGAGGLSRFLPRGMRGGAGGAGMLAMFEKVATAAPFVVAGIELLKGGYEAYQKYQEGDTRGATVEAGGAVGGVAGAFGGAAAGTWIGGLIGTALGGPGVGTAIGAIVGKTLGSVIGGVAGEYIGEWATDAIYDPVVEAAEWWGEKSIAMGEWVAESWSDIKGGVSSMFDDASKYITDTSEKWLIAWNVAVDTIVLMGQDIASFVQEGWDVVSQYLPSWDSIRSAGIKTAEFMKAGLQAVGLLPAWDALAGIGQAIGGFFSAGYEAVQAYLPSWEQLSEIKNVFSTFVEDSILSVKESLPSFEAFSGIGDQLSEYIDSSIGYISDLIPDFLKGDKPKTTATPKRDQLVTRTANAQAVVSTTARTAGAKEIIPVASSAQIIPSHTQISETKSFISEEEKVEKRLQETTKAVSRGELSAKETVLLLQNVVGQLSSLVGLQREAIALADLGDIGTGDPFSNSLFSI